MAKERPTQLELFSHGQGAEQLIAKPVDPGFLDFIKLYEKAILVIIGFVITGITAFCFGVEKGKNIAVTSTGSRLDVAESRKQELPPVVYTPKELPTVANLQSVDSGKTFLLKGRLKNIPVKQEIILEKPGQNRKNVYTIQIGTYKARGGAEKEMAKLRKNGLSPLVIKKSGYTVVCVGAFKNKETAKSLLSQLRSRYRDCYIRRL